MDNYVTSISGSAAIFLVIMSVMTLVLRRGAAIAPLIVTVVLMTIGQVVVIGGAHFTIMRLMFVVGWIRLVVRSEIKVDKKNSMDIVFFYWVVASVIIGLIPRAPHPDSVMSHGFSEEFMKMAGFAFDALGGYFFARCIIRDTEDVIFAIRILVGVSVLLACFMTIEELTGRNLFSVFGAVPEMTAIRDGRFRCQGPFTHPIHAGNFGGTLVPLCIGLFFYGFRSMGILGIIAGSIVTIESASSGPLMAYVFGLLSFFFWRFRDEMWKVRRGILVILIAIELFMKAHIWWLLAHVSDFIGGGGYWRAKLIDQFVKYFWEWWLIGTRYTAHWSPTGSGLPLYPDMMDITNKFVAEGVSGGLLRLSLFIAIIVIAYKRIGIIVHNENIYSLRERFLYWSMGCAMVAYIVAFMSVSSSPQTGVLYYILLAFLFSDVSEKSSMSNKLTEESFI